MRRPRIESINSLLGSLAIDDTNKQSITNDSSIRMKASPPPMTNLKAIINNSTKNQSESESESISYMPRNDLLDENIVCSFTFPASNHTKLVEILREKLEDKDYWIVDDSGVVTTEEFAPEKEDWLRDVIYKIILLGMTIMLLYWWRQKSLI